MSVPDDGLNYSKISTTGAIVLAVVLYVPGLFIGSIGVIIYSFFTALGTRYGDGGWIPFLNGLFLILWNYIFPELVRNVIAVWGALFLARLLFKKSDPSATVFAVAGIWLVLTILLIILMVLTDGISIDLFSHVGSLIGIVAGGALYLSSAAEG